jgi:hypothetical protein
MQVSLRGGKPTNARYFCHMVDVPGVLFPFNDDLLGRAKIREDSRKM